MAVAPIIKSMKILRICRGFNWFSGSCDPSIEKLITVRKCSSSWWSFDWNNGKSSMGRLLFEKIITGVIEGNSIPKLYSPKLIHLFKIGKFPFYKLVQFYNFNDINSAVHDMGTGKSLNL